MTKRQIEETAKFCLDVSKLALASWIFGLFTSRIGLQQIIIMLSGLTLSIAFFILGMRLLKEVK